LYAQRDLKGVRKRELASLPAGQAGFWCAAPRYPSLPAGRQVGARGNPSALIINALYS